MGNRLHSREEIAAALPPLPPPLRRLRPTPCYVNLNLISYFALSCQRARPRLPELAQTDRHILSLCGRHVRRTRVGHHCLAVNQQGACLPSGDCRSSPQLGHPQPASRGWTDGRSGRQRREAAQKQQPNQPSLGARGGWGQSSPSHCVDTL